MALLAPHATTLSRLPIQDSTGTQNTPRLLAPAKLYGFEFRTHRVWRKDLDQRRIKRSGNGAERQDCRII